MPPPISKPALTLFVFAHTPPPLHGQSLMVRTLVTGLPAVAPELSLVHVNPRLSRDAADIGHWRWGKVASLLRAIAAAWSARLRHGPMVFYYVPSPGKRSALYRDWLVLLACRPFCSHLVLHLHGVGLGAWLATHATAPERALTRLLLGRAALALILSPVLADDARALAPRRTAVVPNGLADPGEPAPRPPRAPNAPFHLLFLGLGSRAKGLFDLLEALLIADACAPGVFRLTVAGEFASATEAANFRAALAVLPPDSVRHVGTVDDPQKHALFAAADAFVLPTSHPHEGQPLALIEALAHDVPILTTRWRAIPAMLPTSPFVRYVEPGQPDQIATALFDLRAVGDPAGTLRAHYRATFTQARHLATLADALRTVTAQ